MKKIYLGLISAAVLAGCSATSETTSTETATNNSAIRTLPAAAVGQAIGVIKDPQFTEFRSNSGKSDYWVKHANKNKGLGDVGSSKDTAFGDEGSARLRFVSASDDFTANPGLTQAISGLTANTDYTLSFYYHDQKGSESPSEVTFGLKDTSGKVIASETINAVDVENNPKAAVKKSFRLATLNFNSGSHTAGEVFVYLTIADPSKIDKNGDIGKQTEVRVDEFKISKR